MTRLSLAARLLALLVLAWVVETTDGLVTQGVAAAELRDCDAPIDGPEVEDDTDDDDQVSHDPRLRLVIAIQYGERARTDRLCRLPGEHRGRVWRPPVA